MTAKDGIFLRTDERRHGAATGTPAHAGTTRKMRGREAAPAAPTDGGRKWVAASE